MQPYNYYDLESMAKLNTLALGPYCFLATKDDKLFVYTIGWCRSLQDVKVRVVDILPYLGCTISTTTK